MDDPLFVRGVERLGELACNRERLRYRERTAHQSVGERGALD